ncbi:excalibur calcium-binding domain-containing protein [Sphaerimonospora cavernae]|uniref:Excalibur calcium-binding domain-containing protein n=1 Tax=Sphaerimonospora cavernae TaxID=1740611 RepID=A0ABV6UDP8_9ACTN
MRFPPRAASAVLASVAIAVPLAAASPATAGTRPKSVPKDAVEVTVKKVIDGDQFEVTTSKGATVRVRLRDADAPDPGVCWFEEAFAHLSELLPAGRPAYLQLEPKLEVQDGAYLLYAWSPKGVFVNGDLVRNGYAQIAADYIAGSYPVHRYTAWQDAEQMRAQADRLRIWSGICLAPDTYDRRYSMEIPPGTDQDQSGLAVSPVEPTGPSPEVYEFPELSPLLETGADDLRTPPPTTGQSPAPEATPNPQPDGTGDDPRFGTCEEAIQHNYGPYRRGIDPEYDWYIDRDGDGIVCER